jgi:phenylalanyl-tRNA synthetase beta chain
MKISFNWLKQYIDFKESPAELAKILVNLGLEVENLEQWQSVKGGLEGFVIGEVLECAKHPNADKLSITKVDIGSGEPLNIVCGAPNVAAGQKVVVATQGTKIYSGQEVFEIKKSKIRGEES